MFDSTQSKSMEYFSIYASLRPTRTKDPGVSVSTLGHSSLPSFKIPPFHSFLMYMDVLCPRQYHTSFEFSKLMSLRERHPPPLQFSLNVSI